jgi:hypothetical protein
MAIEAFNGGLTLKVVVYQLGFNFFLYLVTHQTSVSFEEGMQKAAKWLRVFSICLFFIITEISLTPRRGFCKTKVLTSMP